VENAAPTASSVADQTTVTVDQVVNFDGSGSTDPGNDTLIFQWDFEYDGSNFSPDASGPTVNHFWSISGTYTIMLQVDDQEGGVDTADPLTVTVNSVLPLAWLPVPYLLALRKRWRGKCKYFGYRRQQRDGSQ